MIGIVLTAAAIGLATTLCAAMAVYVSESALSRKLERAKVPTDANRKPR